MAKSNPICENCAVWKSQGDKCWYHWEEKQICSQKIEVPEEVEEDNVSRIIDS